jgi:multidrug efflux system outer membrane protein
MCKAATLLLLFLFLSACALGPDYRRPVIDTPSAWRFEEKEAKFMVNAAWWEQFNDPVLNDCIQIALKENKDLRLASARVEEFMGRYGVARAGLYPHVVAGGDAGRQRLTERGQTPLPTTVDNPSPLYHATFGGSWEVDVWGRLRRASEAARANLLSSEEVRRAVILILVSSVANAYVGLRDLDKQLDVARRTAKSREESFDLFTLRFRGGVISELELNQIKSEYEQTLSTIPFIEKRIAQQENALSHLLGRNPGPIPRGKSIDEMNLPLVPEGLPSDLLERRPDIRQAEQELIAANARIGVARALYFPTISLTGIFGWTSADLAGLFSGPSQAWNWASALAGPIFTGGAIAGQVKIAEAVQQQTLIRYQQVIQTAFREVDDSLVDQKRSREQLEIQRRQVSALREYARFARLRYDNGYTSLIEVLDAERSLFNAELSYAQTQGVLFQALVNLYKAMGGGWVAAAHRLTAP